MYLSNRRKPSAVMMLFLAFMLVFGTVFSSPQVYAEQSNVSDPSSNATAAEKKGPTGLKYVESTLTHNSVDIAWDFLEPEAANDIDIWNADTGKDMDYGNFWNRDISGLTPETTYRVYITWHKDRPSREYKSDIITFTTLPDTSQYKEAPLTAPSYLTVTGVTYDSVTLGYGASPNAKGYELYVNNKWNKGEWNPTVTTITYQPEGGIADGTNLTFQVSAQINASNFSPKSNKVSMVWGSLAAPQDLQVVSATTTTAALGWAPVAGATVYDIYRDGTLIGSSKENRFVATNLQEGNTYKFHVVARNDLWQSPASNMISSTPGADYNIVTYYISWAGYEKGRNYQPESMDVSQVTHINYAFSDLCWKKLSSSGKDCTNEDIPLQKDYVYDGEMVIGDSEVDIGHFERINAMKAQNPNLKILVSVGGWSWSDNFSKMAANEITRRTFANSIVEFLREYKLDGIDIDWEYPVEGGDESNSRSPEDTVNFTLMAKTVREALDAAGMEDGKYYLETIAAAQGDNFIRNSDMAVSSAYLDFINIMTYDFSGDWSFLAHHNAPLYYDAKHPLKGAKRNNVQGSVQSFVNSGVPNHKVVLGVPFFGNGWEGCPESGEYQTCATKATSFGTWEKGKFDIYDIEAKYLNKNGYVRYWNEFSKVPYVYNKDNGVFITYNDENTMLYTASIVKSIDIAGVMSWDITSDRNKTLTTPLVNQLPINGVARPSVPAPDQVKANPVSHDKVSISWNAAKGATGYEVFINDQYATTVTDTTYQVQGLTANTTYKVHLLSIVKQDGKLQDVSTASKPIEVTTPNESTSQGNNGFYIPSNQTAKDQLAVKTTKNGQKLIVQVDADAALKTIKAATSPSFRIILTEKGDPIELTIPKEVIAAIAAKGEQATVTIVTPNGEYLIPIQFINVSNDVKVTLQSPAKSEHDAFMKALEAKGLKVVMHPTQIKLEQVKADKTIQEIMRTGKNGITHSYTLDGKTLNADTVTGAVYASSLQQVRSVPTIIKKNVDGTITIQLKDRGNLMYALAQSSFRFSDANIAWAKQDIALAAAKLIASGEKSNVFGANAKINRAEFISMIVRGLGIIPGQASATFTDVSVQSKYAADIAAAKKLGLIKGRTESLFDPEGAITRQEMAVIFANALEYAGKKNTANLSSLSTFKDQANISAFAKSSLAWMIEQKMMQGVSATKLDPKSNATKAQAVVIVMRMLRALELSN